MGVSAAVDGGGALMPDGGLTIVCGPRVCWCVAFR